jgi:hypothetical protein
MSIGEHLGRYVHWQAAEGMEPPIVPQLLSDDGQDEVQHLEVIDIIHEEVPRLDIMAVHVVHVAEGDSRHQLLEVVPHVILLQVALCHTLE